MKLSQGVKPSQGAKFSDPADKTGTRDVIWMSVPMFVELFMQMSVGYVDQIMLSHLGTQPAAAVGNAIQILNLVTIALSAMATASTVLISRALGAGNKGHINEMSMVALVVNAGLALAATFAIFAWWPQLFSVLNVNEDIYAMTKSFLLIVASTTILQGVYFAFAAVLRAFARVGDIMVVNLITNAFNIVGCLVLVNGMPQWGIPAMGVEGSALAWSASRVLGVVLVVWLFMRHTTARMRISCLRPFPLRTLKQMLGIGVPSSGEQFSYDLSQMVILAFVNMLGSAVVTVKVYCSMCASIAYTYSIAIAQATQIVIGYLFGRRQPAKIFHRSAVVTVKVYCSMCASIAYTYSIAIAQATQIVIGYLFGRRQPAKIFHRVWFANVVAMVLSVSISVVLYLNSDFIFGLVTDDPFIHELGRQILAIEILLEVGRSLNIVLVRALIGVGDVKTPVTMNIISSWVVAVGGSWLFGIHFGWGLVGMWLAMCIDEWFRGIFFVVKFAIGRWKKNLPDGPAAC